MKKLIPILFLCSLSSVSFAKPQTYTVLNGGGIDDLGLGLKNNKGKEYHVYCDQKCGDWFEYDEESQSETLKQKYIGKKVMAEIKFENNRDRIAGPGANETLYFIKQIKFIK
ncbi:hypothetical protein [Acinetobacter sp. ANC 3832]|uniref:hypothetical protein n=1 Tax=Acinetobacter sp. ANC 3832 TaxID=1977874 RepID=UPI000A34DE87|nr:hypothetical protein [Acinetobacter sp. ANC 3832]OTG89793.1 hypothetical protein B9T35_16110 [Acinetobacter sp. ANC 3832]